MAAGSGNINIKFSSEYQEVLRAYREMASELDRLNQKLKKTEDASKKAKDSQTEWAESMAKKTMLAVASYVSLSAAISKANELIRESIELSRERDTAAMNFETARAILSQQSGLTGEPLDILAKGAAGIGKTYGMMPAQSLSLATELVSQGVANEDVLAILNELLKGATALSKTPQEINKEFAKAIINFQRGLTGEQGFKKENIAKIFEEAFPLFQKTQFQIEDMLEFVQNASVFTEMGIDSLEQMAMATATLNIGKTPKSGREFEAAFITSLVTAKGDKEKEAVRDKLIGKGTDILALVADIPKLMTTIEENYAKIKPEDRLPALTKLFGKDYAPEAQSFIHQAKNITEMVRVGREGGRVEKTAAIMLGTAKTQQEGIKAGAELVRAEKGEASREVVRTAFEETYKTLPWYDRLGAMIGGVERSFADTDMSLSPKEYAGEYLKSLGGDIGKEGWIPSTSGEKFLEMLGASIEKTQNQSIVVDAIKEQTKETMKQQEALLKAIEALKPQRPINIEQPPVKQTPPMRALSGATQ